MITRSFTLPEEVYKKLKDEINQSALITRLLLEHYNSSENPEILKIRKEKLIKDTESKVQEMDYQIEINEKRVKQIEEDQGRKDLVKKYQEEAQLEI